MASQEAPFDPSDYSRTFLSPGYAVSRTLEDVLTQKRLEARQRMLDSIDIRNKESEIRDRDMNAQYNQEAKKGLEAQRQSTALSKWGSLLSPDSDLDPATSAGIKNELGPMAAPFIRPAVTPESGAVVGPQGLNVSPTGQMGSNAPAVHPDQWKGTAPAIAARDQQTREDAFGKQIMSDPSVPAEVKTWWQMRQALPKGEAPPPPAAWNAPKPTTTHRVEFDTGGNVKSEKDYPAGTSFGQLPNPPQPNAANAQSVYTVEAANSPDGKAHSYWLRPGQLPTDPGVREITPVHKGNEPAAPKDAGVPPALAEAVQKAQAIFAGTPKDARAIANLESAQSNVLGHFTGPAYPQELKDSVTWALSRQGGNANTRQMTTETVIQAIKAKHPELNSQDENALRAMFAATLGR
jgi:hypothetical protein